MDSNCVKQSLFLVTLAGTLLIPNCRVYAEERNQSDETGLPSAGIEAVMDAYQASEAEITADEYLVQEHKGEYWNMGFADVNEDSFLYIRSEPTKDSDWVGKLYPGAAVEIAGPVGEWTKVTSNEVTGYAKTEYLKIGDQAEVQAETQVAEHGSEDGAFEYAVARNNEEPIENVAEETQLPDAALSDGQAVVNFACQFIGNPYVWGGTSLTGGADCSGFVQSVYANFGVAMPRTSYEMRTAGVEVGYENAQPGDVICYDGHVGIYMGDNQIVNAIDQSHGIGISNATFTTILSVRRML